VAHGQRARDRGRAHHQQVRLHALARAAQGQPLRHAKAVLLIDQRQTQPRKLHLLADHRMGAHDQRGAAVLDACQGLRALALVLAAGQPGDVPPLDLQQRLQPVDQLAKVLLGQNFGRRHEGALPTGVDGARRCQRRHHRFAAAHIALQQPVHGGAPLQVGVDLGAHPALGRRERKGQARQQLCVQTARQRGHLGGAARRPQLARLPLRQLLRQQLLGLQALPGRVAAVFEAGQRHLGRRLVQPEQGRTQAAPCQPRAVGPSLRWHGLAQVGALQRAGDGAAQIRLRQASAGRIDRRQAARQLALGALPLRVQERGAKQAVAQLAPGADARTRRERLVLRAAEVEKQQGAATAAVVEQHLQLPPAAAAHLGAAHRALELQRLPRLRLGQGGDAGLVFVAQRQVQRQVDWAQQAELAQRLLRPAQGGGARGGISHPLATFGPPGAQPCAAIEPAALRVPQSALAGALCRSNTTTSVTMVSGTTKPIITMLKPSSAACCCAAKIKYAT